MENKQILLVNKNIDKVSRTLSKKTEELKSRRGNIGTPRKFLSCPPPLFNLESALILFPLLHLSPHKLQNFASKNFFLIDLNHISMSNQNDEGSITLFAFFAVLTVLFPIYVHINIYELYGAVCPEGGGGCLLNSPPNFPILLWSFHQTLYDLFPTVIYNRGGGERGGIAEN